MSNLTDEQLLQAAELMRESGLGLAVSFGMAGGGGMRFVTPAQAAEYTRDPTGFMARQCGVTRDQYVAWETSEGRVQCAGKTASGRPCRNIVKGGDCTTLEKWVRLQGSYCHVHGGE